MGWDDSGDEEDDWDADDIEAKIEAQRKEKERERRLEQGLDSQSEDEEEEKRKAAAANKPKKEKGPTVLKAKAEEEKKPAIDPDQVPLNDPKAEKARLKKLQEERDARLANDLFSGFEKEETPMEKEKREKAEKEDAERKAQAAKPKVVVVDVFDKLELKVQADVDNLTTTCLEKFEKATLAKGGPVKFLSDLLKNLEDSFDLKDLEDLEKNLAGVVKGKKVQKGANLAKDNKANTKINKNTKFNAASEWEEVYGGGGDDEDWTAEEWEAWEKEQAAKGYK